MDEERQSLKHIFRRLVERAMGKALDYGRMSEMSDRAFEQYERSIKKEFNDIINHGVELMEDEGYIQEEEE